MFKNIKKEKLCKCSASFNRRLTRLSCGQDAAYSAARCSVGQEPVELVEFCGINLQNSPIYWLLGEQAPAPGLQELRVTHKQRLALRGLCVPRVSVR